MGTLIYSALLSLDGYTEDRNGSFEWAEPDEGVHSFVNDLERPVATYLYGRRMYEVMVAWEHPEAFPEPSSYLLDFAALWQAADKVERDLSLGVRSELELLGERRFEGGMVHLHSAARAYA